MKYQVLVFYLQINYKLTALTAVEKKIPNISSLVKKRIITQKLVELKKNLLIVIMINILQLHSLIL